MKIHQLPLGARFEYEGVEYVKTGPLIATGNGRQRLIPKYAELRVLGELPAAPAARPERLPAETVLKAFEAFCGECRLLVAEADQPALEAARRRFLQALG